MIPYPQKVKYRRSSFRVTEGMFVQTSINVEPEQKRHLVSQLEKCYWDLFDGADMDEDKIYGVIIELRPQQKKVPTGYYKLRIERQLTVIEAESYPGLVHGMQTLKQIWTLAANDCEDSRPELPCLEIEDWPAFPWRGMHLDTSRHFFDYKVIRRYLDWMANFKLNKFHWHLSDDQGWRLESKRFPRLHEVGSRRKEPDGSDYGGYHTRRQVRMVLDYASDRGIEVIPEIDIPGHAMAILAAYPELACFPRDFATMNVWGISTDILCAGKDSVLDFLRDLLDEVMDLFPGEYIHLGGDEVPKERWKDCPHCQQRIRDQKLHNEEQLQAWFFRQLAAHARKRGKTVIGWDEILDGGADRKAVVMCWRGDAVDAARLAHDNGNRYIICPNNKLYFDWRYCEGEDRPGAFGITTNQDVYELDLSKYGFANPKLFLGGQANLWTERVTDSRTIKELVYFRMQFMAELFWSNPREKDFRECWQRVWDLRMLR